MNFSVNTQVYAVHRYIMGEVPPAYVRGGAVYGSPVFCDHPRVGRTSADARPPGGGR